MSTLLLILGRNLLRTYLTVISVVISSNAVAFVATCSQLYALTLNHTLLAVWIKSNTFFNIFGHIFLWSLLGLFLDYKDFLHKDPSGGQTLQIKFSLIKSMFIKKFNISILKDFKLVQNIFDRARAWQYLISIKWIGTRV